MFPDILELIYAMILYSMHSRTHIYWHGFVKVAVFFLAFLVTSFLKSLVLSGEAFAI
jgi:hypothetical protein